MSSNLGRTVRALRRRPTFAIFAIALLALGVGALSSIFAVVNATLLRPLPYARPDELFALDNTEPVNADSSAPIALAAMQLVRWREEAHAFRQMAGYTPTTVNLPGDGEPDPLRGALISAGMFGMLGVPPALGREFRTEEEAPGSGVAIISHGLWLRRFDGSPGVVGKTVILDGEPRTIIGIMPASFSLLFQGGDVWLPMNLTSEAQTATRMRMIAGVGRLAPGASAAQAQLQLDAINAALGREHPEVFRYSHPHVVSLHESIFGPQRTSLLVMLGAVVLVLLIASVNLLNLTLADAMARRQITMTRLAFGASRRRIVLLRAGESSLIATGATATGLALGGLILRVLSVANPDAFVGIVGPWFDGRVIVVSVVVGLLAGVGSALPAAFSESSLSISSLAGTAIRAMGSSADRRAREALLAAQIAVTVVLLLGASMLVRNFHVLTSTRPGFDTDGVLTVQFSIPARSYPTAPERALYVQRLLDVTRTVPGVEGASSIQTRFVLNETMQTSFEIEGQPAPPGADRYANMRHVMPGVFQVLHIGLRRGRVIDETDRADTRLVAVVSESFARQYWKGDAVGKRIRRVGRKEAQWMEVVGVVDDIRDAGAGVDIGPTMYVSYLQQNTPTARVTVVARTRGDPAQIARGIRQAFWSVDRNQTIEDISPLEHLMALSATRPRFQALVVSMFGVAALALALCGVYAITLFGVVQRTRELGVRSALGAQPADLIRLSMWEGIRPTLYGLGTGALAALPLLLWMQRMLSERLSTADVPMLAGMLLFFTLTALAASFVPAWRAARISPLLAMRS
jgi:putative ABC transport system permease protein